MPMINGVRMPARFALRLKIPLVRPISFFGAMSETTVQPRLVMPCPKKAIDMIRITTASRPSGT